MGDVVRGNVQMNKKEGGYALMVVLVMLIFISVIMMTFYVMSIGSRQQQYIVEDSTIGVGVAEMGITYHHYGIRSELEGEWIVARDLARSKLEQLKVDLTTLVNEQKPVPLDACDKPTLQEWADCKARDIDNETNGAFREKATLKINNYLVRHKDIEQPAEDGSDVTYTLTNITINATTHLDKMEVTLFVTGNSDEKQKNLEATTTIIIPSILSPSEQERQVIASPLGWEEGNAIVFTSTTQTAPVCPDPPGSFMGPCKWPNNKGGLVEYLKKFTPDATGVNIQVSDLCYAVNLNSTQCNFNNSDWNNGSIYIKPEDTKDYIENGNINSLTDANLFYDGLFDIGRFNNVTNNLLVVRSMEAKGSVDIQNTNLLILGGDVDRKLSWSSGISIGSTSKVCINLSGLDPLSSTLFTSQMSIATGGQLLLYPSRLYEALPQIGGGVDYEDNYIEFLDACGVKINSGANDHSIYGTSTQDMDMKTEAVYTP